MRETEHIGTEDAGLTTKSNPGFAREYRPKSLKQICGIILSKIRKRKMTGALYSTIAEGENYLNNRKFSRAGKFFCPICSHSSRAFVNISNNLGVRRKSACPHCMCRARHRGLFFLYKEILDSLGDGDRPVRVLHFAPEPVFYPLFSGNRSVRYFTTDYLLADVNFPGVDIQKMPFVDADFDIVICNHVIEHVENDELALAEVFRILKPGGRAIITVPGDYRRNETIIFDTLENNGHYRDYGLDFVDKMSCSFDDFQITDLNKYDSRENLCLAIPRDELCFIGIKSSEQGNKSHQ